MSPEFKHLPPVRPIPAALMKREWRVDYEVITAPTIKTLVAKVRNYLHDGWQPIGGVAAAEVGADCLFIQAMFKY
jgi:hypothetical protein